jgi:hypothetical protein
MISPSDIEYELTKKIKKGISKIEFPFDLLADWIHATYNAKPINIIYDLLPHDNRPRLQVIFDSQADSILFAGKNRLFPDKTKSSMIITRFKKIVSDLPHYKLDNIFVVFSSFEKVAKVEVNLKVPKIKIDNIKEKVNLEIWEIYTDFYSIVIFFYTNLQLDNYIKDGNTKDKLKNLYFDLFKEYDEFDYLNKNEFEIQFDSKENFDKNYQSNWFYYSRR